MNLNWLKNPNNVVYADVDEFAHNFGKEIGIENLREKLDEFRAQPNPDGVTLTGKRRTAVKLFIPNLMFDENIPMGDTVWLFMGEMYECYCVYWNEATEYKFFSHNKCEYFPCHSTENPEDFNCLFCYCPLYALGDSCGGNFKHTDSGVKDCSDCKLPHKRENYDYIMKRFGDIVELTRKSVNA